MRFSRPLAVLAALVATVAFSMSGANACTWLYGAPPSPSADLQVRVYPSGQWQDSITVCPNVQLQFRAVGNLTCDSTTCIDKDVSTCAIPDPPCIVDTITAYKWYFGDGSTSTESAPTKAYSTAGSYTVTLKVDDAGGTGCDQPKDDGGPELDVGDSMSVTVQGGSSTSVTVTTLTGTTCGAVTYVDGTVTVRASATDQDGLSKIEIYIDNNLKKTCNVSGTSQTCDYSWDTSAYSQSAHSIQAKAYDVCNNSGSHTISRTVDRTAPSQSEITEPENGETVHGTSSTIEAQAQDNFCVEELRFYRDGGVYLGTASEPPPFAITWDTTGVPDGLYSLYGVAYDAVGRTRTSPGIGVTVMNQGCTAGYSYVHGRRPINELTGGEARIKSRHVALCNEGATGDHAHSVAHVYIDRNDAAGYIWAETGWLKAYDYWKEPPFVRRLVFYWLGWKDPDGELKDSNASWHVDPGSDGTHAYTLEMTPGFPGYWSVSYDQTEWAFVHLDAWTNKKGQRIGWGGEIYGLQTDMPGRPPEAERCTFEDCAYNVNYASRPWPGAGLEQAHMFSSDWQNWRWCCLTSGKNFKIWDVSPK